MKITALVVLIAWAVMLASCSKKAATQEQNKAPSATATPQTSPSQVKTSQAEPIDKPAVADEQTDAQQFYLLSGTPMGGYNVRFPVVLYTIGAERKLKVVREVVSEMDGLVDVHRAGDVLFVLYPRDNPKAVSVIHTGDPGRPDEVFFNPQDLTAVTGATVAAEPSGAPPDELIPLTRHRAVEPLETDDMSSLRSGTLTVVSSAPGGASPRIRSDAWDEYVSMRSVGDVGGALEGTGELLAAPVGNNVTLSLFGHAIALDVLPPALIGTKESLDIIAASERYLLLVRVADSDEQLMARDSQELFLHDRLRNVWKTMQIESNVANNKLFGSWLASRLESLYSLYQSPRPVPGRENERNFGTK